jgi:hypothetical protein
MGDFVWVIASSEVLTYHVHIVSFLLLLLLLITHHVSIFFFHQVLRTDSWNCRVRTTGIGRGDLRLAGRNGEPKFDATGEAGEATDFETPLAAHVCSRRSLFAARFLSHAKNAKLSFFLLLFFFLGWFLADNSHSDENNLFNNPRMCRDGVRSCMSVFFVFVLDRLIIIRFRPLHQSSSFFFFFFFPEEKMMITILFFLH